MRPTRTKIAALLAQDLSLAEIARRTGLAYTTVSYHRSRLLELQGAALDASGEEPALKRSPAPVTTREEVHRLLRGGHSRTDVAHLLGLSKSTVTYHARRFGMDIDQRAARRYDWTVIQRYYDAGHSVEECRARFGFCKASWSSAVRRGAVVSRPSGLPIETLLAAARGRANLKRRLIKAGLLTPCCRQCGIREWRGRPLALQLHHVNGVRHDNRLGNLALLCPNCHSQTDTWAGRNGGRDAALRLASDAQSPDGTE